MPTDYWNKGSLSQISGISFLDNSASTYTNFANTDTLSTGSSLYIEAQVNGVDENANSEFSVLIYYTVDDSLWNVKSFDWYSNDTANNKSYWRVSLENSYEISNGDEVKFYLKASDYTQNQYIDDNNGNYYQVSISNNGLARDVTVTFTLIAGALYPDSVSIQGNTAPLSWTIGNDKMDENNEIFTKEILFVAGSNKTVEYKYGAYYLGAWHWESFSSNRTLQIDDSDSTYTPDTDYWNNSEVAEISGVHFLPKSYPSEFTNFDNNETLEDADTLRFEAEVLGADVNSNSGFSIILHFYADSLWQTKQFDWFSNLLSKGSADRSYWRVELYKNTDFSYGDEIKFYITATDYNGAEYSDKNSENPYIVYIGKPSPPQNVTVTKTTSGIVISWDAVSGATSYNLYRSDEPTQGFSLWQSGITTTSVTDTTTTTKKFYYIKSVK